MTEIERIVCDRGGRLTTTIGSEEDHAIMDGSAFPDGWVAHLNGYTAGLTKRVWEVRPQKDKQP